MGQGSWGCSGGSTSLGFDFDTHVTKYEEILGEAHAYYVKQKVRLLRKHLVEKVNRSEVAILDVGCGPGLAEEYLGDGRNYLVGLDMAEGTLRIAKGRAGRADFVHGNTLRMPFADNTFDVAFCFALMHHLNGTQRRQALRETARVTKPGGFVLTFEHNPANPLTRYMVHRCVVDEGVELIHPEEMLGLQKDAGLMVTGIRYLVFFPRLLSFLGSLEALLYWIPLGGQYEVVAVKPTDSGHDKTSYG